MENRPENSVVTLVDAPPTDAPSGTLARLEDLYGFLPRVTASPTWVPRRFQDSFAIDTTNNLFYTYNFISHAWVSAGTSDAHIRSLFSANAPLSYNAASGAFSYFALYGADGGASANTYAIAPTTPLLAYAAGVTVSITIAHTSTGPSTMNVSGLGAKSIKKLDGTVAITKGDLVSGGTYSMIYDGTNFVVQVPVQRANGELHVNGNSGNNTITAGFMPRRVRFEWTYQTLGTSAATAGTGQGTWLVGGTYSEVYTYNSNSSGSAQAMQAASNAIAVVTGQASTNFSAFFSGAVGNLTDTGFDLIMTNATGSTPVVFISWEAES